VKIADVALRYAERGLPVFPLSGKKPLTDHGLLDASKDLSTVRAWWEQSPDANIAIRTGLASGLVVLDVDPEHGGDQSLATLESSLGTLPATLESQTGGGGRHLFFTLSNGQKIRNSTGRPGLGLDVRGEGGYIVAPPSLHPETGVRYTWKKRMKPAPLPSWFADRLSGTPTTAFVNCSSDSVIPNGRRNATLASLAGAMRHRGFGAEAIEAALLAENNKKCQPPLLADEVKRIASSVSRYEPASIDSAHPRDGVRAERKLQFVTAAEIATSTPQSVSWIVRPWIAVGSITELDAKVKLGKTTFVTHLVSKVLDGQPFMGEPTAKTAVVYLTEQPSASFRETLSRAGLLGRTDLTVLFWRETLGVSWSEVMQSAIAQCKACGAGLLIVDTIAQFAKLHGDAENSAGDALVAMEPLQEAAAGDLGVVMVRHERKSGGDVGDSGRGSSAFAGAVDTILSLRRPEGKTRPTLRVVQALSRFSDVPDELFIELTDDGFVSHGSKQNVVMEQATDAILNCAPESQASAAPLRELTKVSGVSRTTAQRVIDVLLQDGRLLRTAGGKRGSAYRYWSKKSSAQTQGLNGQNGNAAEATEVSAKMRQAGEVLARRLEEARNRGLSRAVQGSTEGNG
jgi:Bifunctional DNA primase/polymerase, N-terminal/AAA domain/Primase C terminal 1 (PriCT-1)